MVFLWSQSVTLAGRSVRCRRLSYTVFCCRRRCLAWSFSGHRLTLARSCLWSSDEYAARDRPHKRLCVDQTGLARVPLWLAVTDGFDAGSRDRSQGIELAKQSPPQSPPPYLGKN